MCKHRTTFLPRIIPRSDLSLSIPGLYFPANLAQALNDLFTKIVERDVPARYLLRLGMGEQELDTELDFSRVGRVNAMLARRLELLAEVGRAWGSREGGMGARVRGAAWRGSEWDGCQWHRAVVWRPDAQTC